MYVLTSFTTNKLRFNMIVFPMTGKRHCRQRGKNTSSYQTYTPERRSPSRLWVSMNDLWRESSKHFQLNFQRSPHPMGCFRSTKKNCSDPRQSLLEVVAFKLPFRHINCQRWKASSETSHIRRVDLDVSRALVGDGGLLELCPAD